MNISEKIKEIRKEKRISQRELATRLGVNQSNIVYFEGRGNSLTVEQCISIATALEVSIKSLLFDDIDYTDVPNNQELESAFAAKDKEIEDLRKENEAYQQNVKLYKKLLKDTINHTLDNLFRQMLRRYAEQTLHISGYDLLIGEIDMESYRDSEERAWILRETVLKDLVTGNIKPEYEPFIYDFFVLSMGNGLDYFFEEKYIENKIYINMYKYHKEILMPEFEKSISKTS